MSRLCTGKRKIIDINYNFVNTKHLHPAQWFKYIGAGLTDREIQRRLDACSRHRTNAQNELPATPEGFWVPYFVDTQEEDKKETLVHYRQKN